MIAGSRTPPEGFVQRLKALCGADWDVRWNDQVHRWEFTSLSAAGHPTSQFLGWFTNPFTGERIEPDPVTGLLPFRDLTPDAQEEVLHNLQVSYIGNNADGKNWRQVQYARRRYNRDLRAKRARERGEAYADLIREVAISRPGWKKDHQRNQGAPLVVPLSAPAPAPSSASTIVLASAFTSRAAKGAA